jgi:hypothetical protein
VSLETVFIRLTSGSETDETSGGDDNESCI